MAFSRWLIRTRGCTTGSTVKEGGKLVVRRELGEQDAWKWRGQRSRRGWKRWPGRRCGSASGMHSLAARALATKCRVRLERLRTSLSTLSSLFHDAVFTACGYPQDICNRTPFARPYHRYRWRRFPDPDLDHRPPGPAHCTRNLQMESPKV